MSRRSWWLLLAAVVCMAASFHSARAADEVRSGTKFNPAASPIRKFVRRSVDSTGTVAGALDSAVLIQPTQRMPVPVTMGGVYLGDTSSRVFATDNSGNAKVVDASRDRDLDYYATLINATTVDTAQATSYVLSGIVDVRKYSSGNIIVHIIRAAADSFNVDVEYGVTLFALPTQSYDWTGYGVPIPAFFQPVAPLIAADSTGVSNMWQQHGGTAMALPVPITAGALTGGVAGFGERQITLTTKRPNTGYLPYAWGNTVTAPWSWWLGSLRPRFLGVLVRYHSMSGTYANRPSLRVDIEALR